MRYFPERFKYIASGLFVFLITGCVYLPTPEYGEPVIHYNVTDEDIERLQTRIGEISRAEILLMLGEPSNRVGFDRHLCYGWVRRKGVLFVGGPAAAYVGSASQAHWLCMRFDSDAILIEIEHIEPFMSFHADQKRDKLLKKWYSEDILSGRKGDIELSKQFWTEINSNIGNKSAIIKIAERYCSYADTGNSDAQLRIAQLHEFGESNVESEILYAWVWYTLSARNGNNIAVKSLERLMYELSYEQIESAQEQLNRWMPGQCNKEFVPEHDDKT